MTIPHPPQLQGKSESPTCISIIRLVRILRLQFWHNGCFRKRCLLIKISYIANIANNNIPGFEPPSNSSRMPTCLVDSHPESNCLSHSSSRSCSTHPTSPAKDPLLKTLNHNHISKPQNLARTIIETPNSKSKQTSKRKSCLNLTSCTLIPKPKAKTESQKTWPLDPNP